MAMFSDDADLPAVPSAPLRRRKKRRFDLAPLAPLASTPMPQGQMVSGHYIRPNPIESLTAALQRGLGIAGTVQAGKDEREQMDIAAELAAQKQAEAQADRHLARWQAEASLERQRRAEELRTNELALRERELAHRTESEARRAAEFDRRQTFRENYRPPVSTRRAPSARGPVPNVDDLIEKYYRE